MKMKTCFRQFAVAVAVLFATTTVAFAADEFKAPVATLELEDGDCVVFLGDSITHQRLYTQYIEDYFYTRFPGKRLQLHNAGVGGAKAWDALERFDRDVAAYKPKYVTILLGMNDGSYQPFNQEVFETYQKDMQELLGRIEDIGATPILMTPTMFDARAARIGDRRGSQETIALYNSVLAYYGTWLREVAFRSGYGFVDMYSPLNNLTLAERKSNPTFTMIRDSVHPEAPGQLVMANAILEDMNLPRRVSTIRMTPARRGKVKGRATGGELSDITSEVDTLEFTFRAESLPLVVPDEAQLGAKLVKLGHRMSREAIQVQGLPAGKYELLIDGELVGTYSAAQLGRTVELQGNAKTPQYQQAAQVAALNKQRNEGPIKSLRDDWRRFQTYSRLRAQAQQSPDNEDLARQVAEHEKPMEGMDDRIAEYEAAAKKIEDQIFEVNQPVERKYVLRRSN